MCTKLCMLKQNATILLIYESKPSLDYDPKHSPSIVCHGSRESAPVRSRKRQGHFGCWENALSLRFRLHFRQDPYLLFFFFFKVVVFFWCRAKWQQYLLGLFQSSNLVSPVGYTLNEVISHVLAPKSHSKLWLDLKSNSVTCYDAVLIQSRYGACWTV